MKGTLCLLFVLICMFTTSSSGRSNYSYSIREGNCKGNKVVQEDVVLGAQQNVIRRKDYSWFSRGFYSISCVKVTNNKPQNYEAGRARITEGGVASDYVKIELISTNSRGLDFTVEIWAQEVQLESRRSS